MLTSHTQPLLGSKFWPKPLRFLLNLNIIVIECTYHTREGVSLPCCSTWTGHKKKHQDPEKAVKQHGFICLSEYIYMEGECLLPHFEPPHCFVVPLCQGLLIWSLNTAAWKTVPRWARRGWMLLCNFPKGSFGLSLPPVVQLSPHLQNLADLHNKTAIGMKLISFSHLQVRHVISVCNLSSFCRRRGEKHPKAIQPTFVSHPH